MSNDIATELNTACRIVSERRVRLLGEVQQMTALWMRIHDAISKGDWADYHTAIDATVVKRANIATMQASLTLALKHESKMQERAIDWALKAAGDAGEDEPQTLEGVHHGR